VKLNTSEKEKEQEKRTRERERERRGEREKHGRAVSWPFKPAGGEDVHRWSAVRREMSRTCVRPDDHFVVESFRKSKRADRNEKIVIPTRFDCDSVR